MEVIAAIRSEEEFQKALCSSVGMIFDLSPNLLTAADRVRRAHAAEKKLLAHIDLAEGIGKDRCGIRFLKSLNMDGIISTRVSMIKSAREAGIFTVQRFFIVDSQSIHTTVDSLRSSKADMAEIMPGVLSKVIRALKEQMSVPLIAGGLIETREEIADAERSGAFAISTGKAELWQ